MTIRTRTIDYQDGDIDLQGYLAWDDAADGERPGVMVSHAWRGRTQFENDKAEDLARLGYVGFALDIYGKGVQGSSVEENSALMQPFLDNRQCCRSDFRCHWTSSGARTRSMLPDWVPLVFVLAVFVSSILPESVPT